MRELESATDVYESLGAMMRFVAGVPGCEPWLRQIDETWRLSLTDPEAELTCSFTAEGPLRVEFGPSGLAPDPTITMKASDLSGYMLGELNGFLEIDRGRVTIEGSPIAFLRTIPRLKGFVAPVYRRAMQADDPHRWLLRLGGQRDA